MTKENKYALPRLGKFRILTTQKCNLKCLYCHKEGQFTKREQINPNERKGLIKIASEFGIDEAKYSGGEPLTDNELEKDLEFCKSLLIPKTSITTNGILLEDRINSLKDAYLDELSISLDTLNLETFKILNGGSKEDFKKTLRGIKKAKETNFSNMNLNMSLTKYNVEEVDSMIEYARNLGIQLRLISFIPLNSRLKDRLSTEASEVFNRLKKYSININQNKKNPAYISMKMKDGADVCFVDSSCFNCELCGKSYAIRLTTDGKLKPCLISEKGEIDVITPYRENNIEEVRKRFAQAITIKRQGLMKFFDIPARDLSAEYLTEEP